MCVCFTAMGRIPCSSDLLLMASQSFANNWKLPATSAAHPSMMPNSAVNNLSLAELTSLMATNPAMASLYFGNIPRPPSFPIPPQHQSGRDHQQPTTHQNPNIAQSFNVSSASPFIPISNNSHISPMMSFANSNATHPSAAMMHPAVASVLYASRLQLNSLYQNFKYHPYLNPRFMPPTQATLPPMLSNGKIESSASDSLNESVSPQM